MVFYNGNYYKIGENRAVVTEDKLSDENARLLTMVAIAKELKAEGITRADIVLAVGLPFSEYGRNKQKLKDYYNEEPYLEFAYEGISYVINIIEVLCSPQCYSAVAPRLINMKEDYIVIDIGSKTTDIVYIKGGIPLESKSISLEKAMIKYMKIIQNSLNIKFGKEISEDEILKVMLKKDSLLPREMIIHIREKISEIVQSIELELAEREYDMSYTRIIYVGGGSIIVNNYTDDYKNNVYYDEDIRSNAKGYEYLAEHSIRKQVV